MRSRSAASRIRGSRPSATTTTHRTRSFATWAFSHTTLARSSFARCCEPSSATRIASSSARSCRARAGSRASSRVSSRTPRARAPASKTPAGTQKTPCYTRPSMRAADALCEALKAEGVEHVFGIPGGANLPTYDALYDAELTHIQVRHEQCGGHAAEGYAKASGKVGVALATSGPGATNMVTAIADAIMDSVPTVFITGQVRTELIGTDGFQEADVTGIT